LRTERSNIISEDAAEAANLMEEEYQDEDRRVWREEAETRVEMDPYHPAPIDTNQWLAVGSFYMDSAIVQ